MIFALAQRHIIAQAVLNTWMKNDILYQNSIRLAKKNKRHKYRKMAWTILPGWLGAASIAYQTKREMNTAAVTRGGKKNKTIKNILQKEKHLKNK
jgi:hypothetical protein